MLPTGFIVITDPVGYARAESFLFLVFFSFAIFFFEGDLVVRMREGCGKRSLCVTCDVKDWWMSVCKDVGKSIIIRYSRRERTVPITRGKAAAGLSVHCRWSYCMVTLVVAAAL